MEHCTDLKCDKCHKGQCCASNDDLTAGEFTCNSFLGIIGSSVVCVANDSIDCLKPILSSRSETSMRSTVPKQHCLEDERGFQFDDTEVTDCEMYRGQMLNGKRHGMGILISGAGEYEGEFLDDEQHGQGRFTSKCGRTLEGQFLHGKCSGHGRMEYSDGLGTMVYDGAYVNGLKHGEGTYTWPGGRSYTGQWVKGRMWGQATFVNSRGENRRGYWANGKLKYLIDNPTSRINTHSNILKKYSES